MKERSLTSTWRGPCFRMGGHASSAPCVEKKTRISVISGTTLKAFTSLVISATNVTIARKHSRAKMLCAFTFLKCTNIRNCDAIISHSNSMYLVIIRSDIIKSIWFSQCLLVCKQCSVLLLGSSFSRQFKKVGFNFHWGMDPSIQGSGQKEASGKTVAYALHKSPIIHRGIINICQM